MARIARQIHKIFGGSGSSDNFARFGSLVAGSPIKTKDIATIQSLPAWDNGFQDSIFGGNKDLLLEDVNSFAFEHSTQVAYLLQEGLPEWQTATTYNLDSVVKGPYGGASAGQFFQSLQDNNTGNAPPASGSNAFWKWINRPPVVDGGLTVGAIPRVLTANPAVLEDGNLSDNGTQIVLDVPLVFPDATVQSTAAINTAVAAQSVVTGTRAINTVFHNTGLKPLFVSVSVDVASGNMSAVTDANAAPSTVVATVSDASPNDAICNLFFIVLPGNYYKIVSNGTLSKWTEWQ